VRLRALASILAVAALVAAGITFSGAAFTAASANPGNDFSTAAVFPTVSLTDPGTPLRGTVTLGASTTGAIVSVTIQRSPAGASTWTNICTDPSSPYTCSFDTTVPADGLYDLRATADTGSGIVTSAVIADRRIDNTAPSVTMTDPGTPLSGTVSLGATATDTGGSGVSTVTIQRSPAGVGTWTDVCTDSSSPYSCSFDTTAVGDALYDFRAFGSDVAGNSSTNSTVSNRRIDNVAPTVSLTDPGANLRGTVTLDATASDGGGILNVRFQRSPATLNIWTDICTDATSPYSCSFDTTVPGDGLYDLRALATDNASRTATSTVSNRRIDNTAPSVTMTDPGTPLSGSITLAATATDIGGSGVVNVKIQRSPTGLGIWTDICTDTTSPYSCSLDTTTVSDALYDFRAVGTDVAGNSGNSTVANRRIDNVVPTVSLTDPGANLRGTISLDATASDGGGILNVKIQRSPATLNTWTDICTDATSPYSCSTDTSTWGGDGLYDLRAIATDNASRTATSTVTNRRVDNTLPTVTMTDPGANLRGAITLQATASDTGSGVSSVTIQRSPAGLGIWTDICTDVSSPYSCPGVDTTTWGGDGLYDLHAVTIDVAGNPNTSATVANRRVDNTAPVTALTDPGSPLRGTITLNATGTDTGGSGVLNVKFQRSPAGLSVWTDLCTDTTSPYSCLTNTATWGGDGVYDVRSYATDNAGNTAASAVANRTVDNTAPTATNIQTTNVGGGTATQADTGDTVVFTFSEQIAPGTIVGGWNGTGTQNVTVTLTATTLAIAGATLVNGTISLPGGGYTNGQTVIFSNSTIAQAGATLTLTLGTPDKAQFLRTGGVGQMSWPVAAALTDLAGNAITTVTRLEVAPPNDAEF
jgi:chitinase